MSFAELKLLLRAKKARVGIIGMGYVGLPLAVEFCRAGFAATGIEIDPRRLASLRRGRSYVPDVPSADLSRFLRAGRFSATSDFSALSRQDAVVICVQTPLRKSKEPDVRPILSAVSQIARRLRPGQLIVMESTTYPGTSDEAVLPILSKSGRLGRDFFLACSPERVDPGNRRWSIPNTPKVVGGADKKSTELAVILYRGVVKKVVPVSSCRAAELVKLLENSFRSVNIALVNEMALVSRHLGLDVWEILSAAATKPFGYMPFYPGPGIGGHCIPKDSRLLVWKMKKLRFNPRFIALASEINSAMPAYAVGRIAEMLRHGGKALKGSRVLILGVAYKPGVPDCRESPALDVIHLLKKAGARISYHDPYVPSLRANGSELRSLPLSGAALQRHDCAAVITAHSGVDYAKVVESGIPVFDARNALGGRAAANLERL